MIAASSLVGREVALVVGMWVGSVGRNCEGRLRWRGRRWRGIGAEGVRRRGVRSIRRLLVILSSRVEPNHGEQRMRGVICVLRSCRWGGRGVRGIEGLVFCNGSRGIRVALLFLALASRSWLRGLRGRD